jgi:hypothetical protein
VWVFLQYFVPTVALVFIMLFRIELLIFFSFIIRQLERPLKKIIPFKSYAIKRLIQTIRSQQFVFFTKGDNIANINKVMRYIVENEHTNRIKIVNVLREGEEPPKKLMHEVEVLDLAYPELVVDFIIIRGRHFGPELIQELSGKWGIPKNFMFIGSPGDRFPYGLQELGGVRLVI